jgi:hypothetical protein
MGAYFSGGINRLMMYVCRCVVPPRDGEQRAQVVVRVSVLRVRSARLARQRASRVARASTLRAVLQRAKD